MYTKITIIFLTFVPGVAFGIKLAFERYQDYKVRKGQETSSLNIKIDKSIIVIKFQTY